MEKNINITIVVNTCDVYSDVWELFYVSLQNYWPDRDIEIVFNTEQKNEFGFPTSLSSIHNSNSEFWGERLIQTLNSINTDFVFMLFDDFILEKKFNLEDFKKYLKILKKNKDISAIYLDDLRVHNKSRKYLDANSNDFELLEKGTDYRLNSAPALWRKEHLISYTGKKDTPWAWEVFGSYRTDKSNYKFYHCKSSQKIFDFDGQRGGAIYRGKWVREVVAPKVKKYNLNLDLKKRGFSSDLKPEKRSLLWKINFIFLGYKMVGFDVFKFIFKSIKYKFLNKG